MIEISKSNVVFEEELLLKPFGFKGNYMSEIWQVSVMLKSHGGTYASGLGNQNVLWSDGRVFEKTSVSGGNCIMMAITDRALSLAQGVAFETPLELQEQIMEDLYDFACSITGIADLKKTFVLNAMVPLDNAAWILYAREKGIRNFDDMIPAVYAQALSYRHRKVASVPLASYTLELDEIEKLVKQNGYFIMKVKLGAPGTQREMLEKDKERLAAVHQRIGPLRVPHTVNGKIPYYFDANGRYESKEVLAELLDYAEKIGAKEQIMVFEEPFPEDVQEYVGDLGVLVVADESAHSEVNVRERIDMGYGAIALKPAAKTMSMTMKMALEAHKKETPCFCADLTVHPLLVDWNKNVAARLAPLPGLDMGLLETNGHQNYSRWERMMAAHPCAEASWIRSRDGVFHLDDDFYRHSGGIFKDSGYFLKMHPSS